MLKIRDNKLKQLTSHKAAAMFMRAYLPIITRTNGLGIVVCWTKEVAP
jgi:hypothetical protein